MVKVFVAGSRKFSEDIAHFCNLCLKNNISARLPIKPLGELDAETEIMEIVYAYTKGNKIISCEKISHQVDILVLEVLSSEDFIT